MATSATGRASEKCVCVFEINRQHPVPRITKYQTTCSSAASFLKAISQAGQIATQQKSTERYSGVQGGASMKEKGTTVFASNHLVTHLKIEEGARQDEATFLCPAEAAARIQLFMDGEAVISDS